MYLTAFRPDIMFVVCARIRFQVTSKVSHLYAVKRIFRYLKGQPKLGLWKSTTGGCRFRGRRLISWQCKKQTIVANSTTEAEYVAASSCCGQVCDVIKEWETILERVVSCYFCLEAETGQYALMVNPTIYTSCIKQFWATAKKQSRRKQRKDSGPTKPITDEATNEDHASTPSYDPFQSGEDRMKLHELMHLYAKLSDRVLALENTNTSQAAEIATLKERVKKLEKKRMSKTYKPRRLYKVGLSRRIKSSDDASLGAQEDTSKQGRKIADLDVDTEVTLIDETQGRNDEDLMFDISVLNGDEVFQEPIVNSDTTIKSSIPVSAADLVTTAGEVVTTASVEILEELTLA
ncbi:hypothetical protein Tco_1515386 [Tanacetum coccineum]